VMRTLIYDNCMTFTWVSYAICMRFICVSHHSPIELHYEGGGTLAYNIEFLLLNKWQKIQQH
jgi:hypothetical protein